MRQFLLLALLIPLASCKLTEKQDSKPDNRQFEASLAYSRGRHLHYFSANSSKSGSIFNAYDPSISPNGLELAYTEYYKTDRSNEPGSNRRIVILNLETGRTRKLVYNSPHYYGPIWSHDGKTIAFNAFAGGSWHIVLVDSSLKNYKILTPEPGFYSISWSMDDKEILTQNLHTLFFIDTSTMVKKRMLLEDLIKERSISSSNVFCITVDKKYLIFNSENNEPSYCNKQYDLHDSPEALYKYDLLNKTLKKLTPDSLYCSDFVISNNKIYFTASQKCKPHDDNIYTMSLEGENLTLFIKHGNSITIEQKKSM